MGAHEDVTITALGATAMPAGLVLVFLGIVVTSYQSHTGDAPSGVTSGFRKDAIMILTPFTLGVACVGISTIRLLLAKNNKNLCVAVIVVSFVQLASLLLASGLITKRVLWT